MQKLGTTNKASIRVIFLNKRKVQTPKLRDRKSAIIKKKVLALPQLKDKDKIMIYLAKKEEVETKGLINALLKNGKKIFVPVKGSKNYFIAPLLDWQTKVDPSQIEVALIPGVAFFKNGLRIGFGKGIFDKLLKKTRAVKIGLAFDFQVTNKNIRSQKHDVKLDLIVTEKTIYKV